MDIRSPKTAKADLVAAEASVWFIEFRTGDVTSADRARFDEWLRRSPDHIQAYLEIAEGWAELPTSDPEQRLDIPALVARARESRDENVVPLSPRETVVPKRKLPSRRAWAASLAGVALVLGLAVWGYLYHADTYRTGVGEQRTVRLLDGSTIELNALSSIRVRLSKNTREVDLREGQALFRVAKDSARPFVVHSDGTTVRAVGTQFDVYRKDTGTVVTVVEGRVTVAEADNTSGLLDGGVSRSATPLFLVAGEQVTMPTQRAAKEKPRRADVAVATAWVQKRLIFEETPLAEVAEEFNRYNSRRLVIVGPQLGSVGISGVYSSTDPDSLLGFLRAQPNIELRETESEIRVSLRERK
jgi:transmembrane sensor